MDSAAHAVFEMLKRNNDCLVLAESCTAGLIAATLGRIPGVSQVLAGSAVVYQLATKTAWLEIPAAVLESPGPVSQMVAEQMAINVLQKTVHASISLSITGHLGPDAPPELDGVVWSAIARSDGSTKSKQLGVSPWESPAEWPEFRIDELNDRPGSAQLRQFRQAAGVLRALKFLLQA